jgi:predicted transcriptional regulator
VADCCSVDLSVVSRHLAILARAGVLSSEKRAKTVHYTVRYADLAASLRAMADAIDACIAHAPDNCTACCGPRACCTPAPRKRAKGA